MADLASVLAGLKGGMGASITPAERERMLMMEMGQGQPQPPGNALTEAMMGMAQGAPQGAFGAAMPDQELERYRQMQQGEMIGGAPPVGAMGAMDGAAPNDVLSAIMGGGMMSDAPPEPQQASPNVNDYLTDGDGGLRFMKDSQAATERLAAGASPEGAQQGQQGETLDRVDAEIQRLIELRKQMMAGAPNQ